MSAVFLLIGLIVNRRNAKYLLSGYNMLSADERKAVNLNRYIPLLKKFHLFLGFSFLGIGLFLKQYYGDIQTGIFLGVYPLLAYLYLIWRSREFVRGTQQKKLAAAFVLLALMLVFISGLFIVGLRENRLLIHTDNLEITGLYGEIISKADIKSLTLVRQLPEIKSKTNGFNLGAIDKGYFITGDGVPVKLILNSDQTPILRVTRHAGKEIYYSAESGSNIEIYNEIISVMPDIPRIP
ncbi:MAG: DUF3784 domain-containing protein [FCB group bacterium]|nr:DUF3784 domain-containing protein [FCB group bacterium]